MKELCYYHIFGGKANRPPKDGWGNCFACQPDIENKKCRGYIRIRINEFEVKEEKK